MKHTRRKFIGGVAVAAIIPLGLKWPEVRQKKNEPPQDGMIWGLPTYDLRVRLEEPTGRLMVKATHRYVSDCFNTDQMQESRYHWECDTWGYETIENGREVVATLEGDPLYFAKALTSWENIIGCKITGKTMKVEELPNHVHGEYVIPQHGWILTHKLHFEAWYKRNTQLHKEALDEYVTHRDQ